MADTPNHFYEPRPSLTASEFIREQPLINQDTFPSAQNFREEERNLYAKWMTAVEEDDKTNIQSILSNVYLMFIDK